MIRKWWNHAKLHRIKNSAKGRHDLTRITIIGNLSYLSERIVLTCLQSDRIPINTHTPTVGALVEKLAEAIEYLQDGNTKFKLGGVHKDKTERTLSEYLQTTDGFVLAPQEADEVVSRTMLNLAAAIEACIADGEVSETYLLRKLALVVEDAIAFRVNLKEVELN